jgi:hypothetical protein
MFKKSQLWNLKNLNGMNGCANLKTLILFDFHQFKKKFMSVILSKCCQLDNLIIKVCIFIFYQMLKELC